MWTGRATRAVGGGETGAAVGSSSGGGQGGNRAAHQAAVSAMIRFRNTLLMRHHCVGLMFGGRPAPRRGGHQLTPNSRSSTGGIRKWGHAPSASSGSTATPSSSCGSRSSDVVRGGRGTDGASVAGDIPGREILGGSKAAGTRIGGRKYLAWSYRAFSGKMMLPLGK